MQKQRTHILFQQYTTKYKFPLWGEQTRGSLVELSAKQRCLFRQTDKECAIRNGHYRGEWR